MAVSLFIPSLLKTVTVRPCLLLLQYKMAKQLSTAQTFSSSNKMAKYQPVSHVIFDMDGLLLDTVHLYEDIRRQVLSEFGHVYDFQANMKSQGKLSSEVAQDMVADYNLPITPEEYIKRSSRIAAEVFSNAQLLPDTEIIYEKMISQIAQKYNKVYTNEIKLKVLGTNEQRTAATVISECKLPITSEEFLKDFHYLQTELGNCELLPGAERLIRHLHEKKVPIAVATSSGKDSVVIKTEKFQELFGLFHHVVMGSSDPDVKNGKPAPDIFLVCASRFDDKPSSDKCLVFEDAPNGVTGARDAGMQAVMVPDALLPAERTTHATQVIKSLLDFKPEDFGLPPF